MEVLIIVLVLLREIKFNWDFKYKELSFNVDLN